VSNRSMTMLALSQGRNLDDFSVHSNFWAVLDLIESRFDADSIDELDKAMDMLQVLVNRHRRAHNPGQSPPRDTFEGMVESGRGMIQAPVRIETDRFHLWIYPDTPTNPDNVRVEMEAK